jgi:hypothetical protein
MILYLALAVLVTAQNLLDDTKLVALRNVTNALRESVIDVVK